MSVNHKSTSGSPIEFPLLLNNVDDRDSSLDSAISSGCMQTHKWTQTPIQSELRKSQFEDSDNHDDSDTNEEYRNTDSVDTKEKFEIRENSDTNEDSKNRDDCDTNDEFNEEFENRKNYDTNDELSNRENWNTHTKFQNKHNCNTNQVFDNRVGCDTDFKQMHADSCDTTQTYVKRIKDKHLLYSESSTLNRSCADILTLMGSSVRVLVVGDTIVEKHVYGSYSKLTKENSMPVFKGTRTEIQLGGVPNAVKNLKQFGIMTDAVSIIGEKDAELENKLKVDGIEILNFIKSKSYRTRRFTKYCNNNLPVFIVDDDYSIGISIEDHKILKTKIESLLNSYEYHAIVLEDCCRTLLNDKICKLLLCHSISRHLPVFVYSNNIKDFKKFRNSSCIVFNADRLDDENDIGNFCQEISHRLEIPACVVTLSDRGTGLYQTDSTPPFHVIPFRDHVHLHDTDGVSDAILAACVFGKINKWRWLETCHFASECAANVLKRLGITPIEVIDVIGQTVLKTKQEIISLRRIIPQERVVAVAVGCFDLLPVGHLELLRQAREHSDILIVLINSDVSMKKQNGGKLSTLDTQQRCDMLLSTKYVNFIVICDDQCLNWSVKILSPDIFIRGGEHDDEKCGTSVLKKAANKSQSQSTSNIK